MLIKGIRIRFFLIGLYDPIRNKIFLFQFEIMVMITNLKEMELMRVQHDHRTIINRFTQELKAGLFIFFFLNELSSSC